MVPTPMLYNGLVVQNKGKLQAADHSVGKQLQGATCQSQITGQYVDSSRSIVTSCVIELVDSISRNGPDTPIHAIQHKKSAQVRFGFLT